MESKKLIFLLIIIALLVPSSCEKEDPVIKVTSVSISKNSIVVTEGDINKLQATVSPADATNKSVTWKSSDASVVSVDQNGEIVAKKVGSAAITVTSEDGMKTASCNVVVEERVILVTAVTLNKTELTLYENESEKLTAVVVPADATYKDIEWSSNNEDVATVDAEGNVTALKEGTAQISATAQNSTIKSVCTVVVEKKVIPVTAVSLNYLTLVVDLNETGKLVPIFEPTDASNRNITWISDDEAVATVDSNGNVVGVSYGNTTVTATTEDGEFAAVCDVIVAQSWLTVSEESSLISGAAGSFEIEVDASHDWIIGSKPGWITVSPSASASGNVGVTSVELSATSYSGTEVYRSGEVVFKLKESDQSDTIKVDQYNFPYKDGDYVKVQSSTKGDGIDLVFMGDGYTIEDIASGKFRKNLDDGVKHFFDIEPYRSYKEYFNVYIVYAFSEESGISDHEVTKNSKFSAKYENPNSSSMSVNDDVCFDYAEKVPLLTDLTETLVIVVTNSSRYAGTNWTYSNGMSISIVPVSTRGYPYNFRAVMQHEAGGHGFGKLADEYVNFSSAIDDEDKNELRLWQEWDHFLNVDLTNDPTTILWNHFYSDEDFYYVGAHEGAYYYAFGVWRSEAESLMINNITYINARGRELIVRRIKKLAGETFTFEEFKEKDVKETQAFRSAVTFDRSMVLPPPVLIKVK